MGTMSANESLLSLNATLHDSIGGLLFIRQHASVYIPYMVITSLILVFGTTGNILLICAIYKSNELRNSGNLLIVNMAVGDILTSLIPNGQSLIGLLFGENIFLQRNAVCVTVAALGQVSCNGLLLTLPTVAVNRYIKICRPQLYEKFFSRRKTIAHCLVVWLLSIAATSFQFTGWAHYTFDRMMVACMFDRTATISYTVFMMSFSAVVPGCVSGFCYSRIFLFVRASKRKVNSRSSTGQRVDINLSLTLFLVWIVYFILVLPFSVLFIVYSSDTLPAWPYIFSLSLAFSDAVVNPILYGVTNKSFRKGFIVVLRLQKWFPTSDVTTTGTSQENPKAQRPVAPAMTYLHAK